MSLKATKEPDISILVLADQFEDDIPRDSIEIHQQSPQWRDPVTPALSTHGPRSMDGSYYHRPQKPQLSAPTEYIESIDLSYILPVAFDEPIADPSAFIRVDYKIENLELLHDLSITDFGILLDNSESLRQDLSDISKDRSESTGASLSLYLNASPIFEEILYDQDQSQEYYHSHPTYIDCWLLQMTVACRSLGLTIGTRIYMWLLASGYTPKAINTSNLSALVERHWFDNVDDRFVSKWLEDPEAWWKWSTSVTPRLASKPEQLMPWYAKLGLSRKSTEEAEEQYQPGIILTTLVYDQKATLPTWSEIDSVPPEDGSHVYTSLDGDILHARQIYNVILRTEYGSYVAAPLDISPVSRPMNNTTLGFSDKLDMCSEYGDDDLKSLSRKRTPTTQIHMMADVEPDHEFILGSKICLTRPQTIDWNVPTRVIGKLLDSHSLSTLVYWIQEGLDSGEDGRRATVTLSRSFRIDDTDTATIRPRKKPRQSSGWID